MLPVVDFFVINLQRSGAWICCYTWIVIWTCGTVIYKMDYYVALRKCIKKCYKFYLLVTVKTANQTIKTLSNEIQGCMLLSTLTFEMIKQKWSWRVMPFSKLFWIDNFLHVYIEDLCGSVIRAREHSWHLES